MDANWSNGEFVDKRYLQMSEVHKVLTLPKSQYIPVTKNGKLLFKFDPVRFLIEIQQRGVKEVIDLTVIAEKELTKPDDFVKNGV